MYRNLRRGSVNGTHLNSGIEGLPQVLGSPHHAGIFRSVFDLGGSVAWILRLAKVGAEGEGRSRTAWKLSGPTTSPISPTWG
jgi:hypothetical protein